jgi:very-short-patch-repair endonuclease
MLAELRTRLTDPNQRSRSFAIVTLSRAQQELVEDILDDARFTDSALAAAFDHPEPLLVGTPDRLQGEERDVAFVSIGDSADALGALAHPGGQRWLNVAITRAREQLVLVSSFDPEQLLFAAPLSSDPAAGEIAPSARMLAELLAFARAGGGASKPAMDTPPASPITAAIARALTERGWQVAHNIGCGAYKLDLAIVDPNEPERYVLAIEHDGPAYASSHSARSRDRLRAQLLTQLGWRLHRVWSLDWWLDPEREIHRAHGAIVAAIAASRQRKTAAISAPMPKLQYKRRARGTSSPALEVSAVAATALETTAKLAAPEIDSLRSASSLPTVDEGWALADETRPISSKIVVPASGQVLAAGSGPTDAVGALPFDLVSAPIRLPRGAIPIGPYTAAAVPAGRRAPDDMFAPRYLSELGKCIEQVLAAEAPIHIDLLARRCAAYFGIGRVTQRVTEQIKTALKGRGRLGPEENIVWRADQDPACVPPVRVAGTSASARREITEVPLSEVAAAARIVVERANGMSATDLVRDCARLLGFARITETVTERVALGVRLATARELITIDGGKAHLLLDG